MIQAPAVSFRATLAALALGPVALAAGTASAQQAAPAVTVVEVEQRDITPSVSFTGRIEAVDKVDLRARVEGFLDQRLFEEGQEVKARDLLFVIEKAPYQAEIETVNAAIARAQATLDLAEIERRRQAELVRKQATAQAWLDEATGKAGEARADLRRQQASLITAKLNLGYTDVKAPIAGRIGRSMFSVGDFVGPSSETLATIVSQDPMYMTFPVTQRQLLKVRKGANAASRDPKNIAVKVRLHHRHAQGQGQGVDRRLPTQRARERVGDGGGQNRVEGSHLAQPAAVEGERRLRPRGGCGRGLPAGELGLELVAQRFPDLVVVHDGQHGVELAGLQAGREGVEDRLQPPPGRAPAQTGARMAPWATSMRASTRRTRARP
jgi:biotin carboxyl carrier protein